MKRAVQHIHFVGIGGAGMSAIAEILHHMGYRVSGSDQHDSSVTRRLAEMGVTVHIGHAAEHVPEGAEVVYSSAVPADNPERARARQRGWPERPRAELLRELTALKRTLAVAGAHGKTTTTSMIAAPASRAAASATARSLASIRLASRSRSGGRLVRPLPPALASASTPSTSALFAVRRTAVPDVSCRCVLAASMAASKPTLQGDARL